MNIEKWLTSFKLAWTKQDIEMILSLFDENVEYWETPNKLLESFEELGKEWEAINNQSNIRIETSLYSSYKNKHSVIWKLEYLDQDNKIQKWSGTYLITLNNKGLCVYFHHTGEKV